MENAQIDRKHVAKARRQKFASVPPINFAERLPQMTEMEKKMVVKNAGNILKVGRRRVKKIQSHEAMLSSCD
ncbi:hypothetical protein [Pedosphaera parvula]|uniref:hypothetical protein n=1 Tax=Pedosphaera parvula TaxID=1032527 RepID=UPI00031E1ACE|nr:hypothetical protein [Pedosphaera parvula]